MYNRELWTDCIDFRITSVWVITETSVMGGINLNRIREKVADE